MKSKEDIEKLEAIHQEKPHERHLQKELAKELTILVHSLKDYKAAVEASQILFKGTVEDLAKLDETMFLDIFDGVPMFDISKAELESGIGIIDLLAEKTSILPSKSEARKLLQGGGVSLNKEKITDAQLLVNMQHTINNKYILFKKGKTNNYLVSVK